MVSEMDSLLDAVTALVRLLSRDKVEAVAARVSQTQQHQVVAVLGGVLSTPAATEAVSRLAAAWQATAVSANELALMLRAAGHVATKTAAEQTVELVWTGPTTPVVAARRTEQALLQVINAAKATLFITSFVAYDVTAIVKALNAACERGVLVSMLLESSSEHGGSINMDVIGKMRGLVPAARLYAWQIKADPFADGRVHAKVAVADGLICFITSANLTGFAMEKNMEAGVLISGGEISRQLHSHLQALVDTKLVSPA
jgi:cardiolipin synthase